MTEPLGPLLAPLRRKGGATLSRYCLLLFLAFALLVAQAPQSAEAARWFSFGEAPRQQPSARHTDDDPREWDHVYGSTGPATQTEQGPPMAAHGGDVDAKAKEQSRALWAEMEAKGRMSPCWKRSLSALRSDCATINAKDGLRSRLALAMAACDSEGDGRGEASVFHCATGSEKEVRRCVGALSEAAYSLFVQYRLHTDVLCAYLQEELFQQRTAAAVAALQRATADSAQAMAALKDTSSELLTSMHLAQAAQQQTQQLAAELQTNLGALQAGQTQALARLQVSTNALHTRAEDASRSLADLQGSVAAAGAEATTRLRTLEAQAAAHYDSLERRTNGLLHLLGRVEEVQRSLAERSFSTQEMVKFVCAGVAVLLCTAPPQTAAARLPALAAMAAGWLMPLLLPAPLRASLPWFSIGAGAAIVAVAVAAHLYRSPASIQRQVVREELRHVMAMFRQPPPQTPLVTSPSPVTPTLLPVTDRVPSANAVPITYGTPLPIHRECDTESDGAAADEGEADGCSSTPRSAAKPTRRTPSPRGRKPQTPRTPKPKRSSSRTPRARKA